MNVKIDLAVLLAVILFFRLRPSGEPRTSGSVQITAAMVLVLGLLLAGTGTGEVLLGGVREVVGMLD